MQARAWQFASSPLLALAILQRPQAGGLLLAFRNAHALVEREGAGGGSESGGKREGKGSEAEEGAAVGSGELGEQQEKSAVRSTCSNSTKISNFRY
jgi:hypothetical protein